MNVKTRTIIFSSICVFVFLFSFFYYRTVSTVQVPENPRGDLRENLSGSVEKPGMTNPAQPGRPMASSDFVNSAVSRLKADFGNGPLGKATQRELLGLKNYLADHFPGDYHAIFREIIEKAYPDQVDEILKTVDLLYAYNQWFDANKTRLGRMSYEQIKEELWSKRKAMFGQGDAGELWGEETRKESIVGVMEILKDSHDTSLDDKLALYRQAVVNTYDGSGVTPMEDKKYNLTRGFLGMDSVQAQLADMDETRRAESLQAIREAMGYTREDRDALAIKDAASEKKWRDGYAYMAERERLQNEPDDETKKIKITALQNRYFNYQASTIQAEEASGFFRFNRPRVYGRN